jgi:hypothetical protein
MPRYTGKFFACPACGQPAQQTSSRGAVAFVCNACWHRALIDLVVRHALSNPMSRADCEARLEQLIGHRQEVADPRPPQPLMAVTATKIELVLDHLRKLARAGTVNGPDTRTKRQLDRELGMKKGTAARALTVLLERKLVSSYPDKKRGGAVSWGVV